MWNLEWAHMLAHCLVQMWPIGLTVPYTAGCRLLKVAAAGCHSMLPQAAVSLTSKSQQCMRVTKCTQKARQVSSSLKNLSKARSKARSIQPQDEAAAEATATEAAEARHQLMVPVFNAQIKSFPSLSYIIVMLNSEDNEPYFSEVIRYALR